jgi:hypothetical protein
LLRLAQTRCERRRNGETISTVSVREHQSGGQRTVREEQGGVPPIFLTVSINPGGR